MPIHIQVVNASMLSRINYWKNMVDTSPMMYSSLRGKNVDAVEDQEYMSDIHGIQKGMKIVVGIA